MALKEILADDNTDPQEIAHREWLKRRLDEAGRFIASIPTKLELTTETGAVKTADGRVNFTKRLISLDTLTLAKGTRFRISRFIPLWPLRTAAALDAAHRG